MENIPIHVWSISYNDAPVDERQKIALDVEEQKKVLHLISEIAGVYGTLFLSTCNRVELYYTGNASMEAKIEELLSKFSNLDIHWFRRYVHMYVGESGVRHLFRVASGLDSMLIGEDEILGQMKRAYKFAQNEGVTDYYINTLFQKAFACAKKIKTQTCLSKTSISVATLVTSSVTHFKDGFKKVMIIGSTGEIGTRILQNLLTQDNIDVYVTKRQHNVTQCFVTNRANIHIVEYAKRYDMMDDMDVIISATSSPHYVITYNEYIESRVKQSESLLIDVAIPRDIDPDLGTIENLTLQDMDYYKALAHSHNEQKKQGVSEAEYILGEAVEDAIKEIILRNYVNRIKQDKVQMADVRYSTILYKVRKAASLSEFETVVDVFDKIMWD